MGKGGEVKVGRPGLGLAPEGPCEGWAVEQEMINASGQEAPSHKRQQILLGKVLGLYFVHSSIDVGQGWLTLSQGHYNK